MKHDLTTLFEQTEKNYPGLNDFDIIRIQKDLEFELPTEYLDLMKVFNGCEGEVGENSWLLLFEMSRLVEVNKNYSYLLKDIPNYLLIGKDAADTGYAIHKEKGTFHSFGLMSNFKTDPIEFCGNNFNEFILYLYNY